MRTRNQLLTPGIFFERYRVFDISLIGKHPRLGMYMNDENLLVEGGKGRKALLIIQVFLSARPGEKTSTK